MLIPHKPHKTHKCEICEPHMKAHMYLTNLTNLTKLTLHPPQITSLASHNPLGYVRDVSWWMCETCEVSRG